MVKGLNTILGEMEGIYNSIDVRVAALRRDRQSPWQNFMTVIRYSYLPKEQIEQMHKQLIWLSVVDQFDKFRIAYKAFSIDEDVFGKYEDGTDLLELGMTKVYYWKHAHPNELAFNYLETPEFICGEWGALYGQANESASGMSREGNFMTEQPQYSAVFHNEKEDAIKLGFDSISEAIRRRLEIRSQIHCGDAVVYYVCPLYAKIDKLSHKDGQFWLDLDRHFKLSDLKVNFKRGKTRQGWWGVYEETDSASNIEMQNEDKSSMVVKEHIPLRPFEATDALGKVLDEVIDVSLAYPKLSLIVTKLQHVRVRELLATGQLKIVNPLLASFELFCSKEELKEMLLEAHKLGEKGGKTQQVLFERGVAWLLELGGYRAIWLDEKQHWREGGRFEHGSADILAFNDKTRTLYVIGCTLDLPKNDDIVKIADFSGKIDGKIFGELYPDKVYAQRLVKVMPVYVYAHKSEKTITQLAREKGVISIALEGVAFLYDELAKTAEIRDLKELENYIYMQEEAI